MEDKPLGPRRDPTASNAENTTGPKKEKEKKVLVRTRAGLRAALERLANRGCARAEGAWRKRASREGRDDEKIA